MTVSGIPFFPLPCTDSRDLPDPTRYLLVRLVLRQPEWHALSSLHKYSSEIGEEGLEEALKTLCVPVKDLKLGQLPTPSPNQVIEEEKVVKKEEEDVTDLTFLYGGTTPPPTLRLPLTQRSLQATLTKPSTKASDHEIEEPVVDPANLKFDFLFRDQSSMTVREALTRLTLPDLREISRCMKVGTPTMRVS